eukprot:TRINITY_DN2539_c0_g1_i4.p1 TRINITY_DN2539_c0_g1~~TRINITY_DN2539_c0_g1_i4.p1  ORF type:complete len:268 (-),score=44.53 TRINITY_DN2539_c0_g1_i4:97-900(-)
MSFADHGSIARDSTQRKTNGSHENSSNGGGSNMDQISEELSELKRNIERFENQKRRIPSDEYQKFLKDNMDLYSKLNDILKRLVYDNSPYRNHKWSSFAVFVFFFASEMKRSNQQNQNYLLKFEKILNEQSKKLKAVSLQMKRAVEEETTDENRTLLNHEEETLVEDVALDMHEESALEREKKIKDVHSRISAVSHLYREIGEIAVEQTMKLDTVEENLVKAENKTKEANKELLKAKAMIQKNRDRHCKMLFYAVMSFVVLVLYFYF